MEKIESTYVGRREYSGGKVMHTWVDKGTSREVGRNIKGGGLIIGGLYQLEVEGNQYLANSRRYLAMDEAASPGLIATWELEDDAAQLRQTERSLARKHRMEIDKALDPIRELMEGMNTRQLRAMRAYIQGVL